MNVDQIAVEALQLPIHDRALLAASLWESIEDSFEMAVERTDADAISLAMERDRELESGSVQALSHSEMMNRLRR